MRAVLTTRMPLPATGSNSLVAASGYCVGFVIVVLGRQQLFTESTLTVILPVLTRRDARTLFAALRLWTVVLLANLAGTWIFASILVLPTPFMVRLAPALQTLAQSTLESDFGTTMLKATLAGWLVGLLNHASIVPEMTGRGGE